MKQKPSFYYAAFILMLSPAMSNCMLLNWLTEKEFFEQRNNLKKLRQENGFTVKRRVNKNYEKWHQNGNTSHLIKETAYSYKESSDNSEITIRKIDSLLKKMIGKRYSNLPEDPDSSIGIILWVSKKEVDPILQNYLKTYLTNPSIFVETISNRFYGPKNNEVFA